MNTKTFFTLLCLVLPTILSAHSQYAYTGWQWNKTSLKYYINHNTTQMIRVARQEAIDNAFETWAYSTVFSFENTNSESNADIILSWESGYHGASCEEFDGSNGTILAHILPDPSYRLQSRWNSGQQVEREQRIHLQHTP